MLLLLFVENLHSYFFFFVAKNFVPTYVFVIKGSADPFISLCEGFTSSSISRRIRVSRRPFSRRIAVLRRPVERKPAGGGGRSCRFLSLAENRRVLLPARRLFVRFSFRPDERRDERWRRQRRASGASYTSAVGGLSGVAPGAIIAFAFEFDRSTRQ